MSRRNLLKRLKNKVQDPEFSLQEENEKLKIENQELKERIEKYDKHYSEIIEQLKEGYYDNISDKILQRQNEILRNRINKQQLTSSQNFILLARINNICCKMLKTNK